MPNDEMHLTSETSNQRKLLVGSDGALYCRVRPPPLMLFDPNTGRVENAHNMGMMPPPYFRQASATMPVGLGGSVFHDSSLNMANNPFSRMSGLPSFHPVGPGIMQPLVPQLHPPPPGLMPAILPADLAYTRLPSSLVPVESEAQARVLSTSQFVGGTEVLDARRRALFTRPVGVDSNTTLLESHSVDGLGLTPFQAPLQGTLSMSDMRLYYGVPNRPRMLADHHHDMTTDRQGAPKESELVACLRTASGEDKVSNMFMEPSAKRPRLMPLQEDGTPAQECSPPSGVLSMVEVSSGGPTFLPVCHESMGERHASAARRVFPLYMKCDDRNLSLFQCLARKQLEIFEATEEDAGKTAQGRNKPIVPGQIGLRCIHCVNLPNQQKKAGAAYYPSKLDGIYQVSQKMIMMHLMNKCTGIPKETREQLISYKAQTTSSDGGRGKKYWREGVELYGVYETGTNGLAFRPDAAAPEDPSV